MAKTSVIVANVIGQVATLVVSPFFECKGIKERYFDGYRKISDIFPDTVLASFIAEHLGKTVEQKILCEELHLLRNLVYRAEKKEQIRDFSGIEYLGNLEVIRLSHLTELKTIPPVLQELQNLKVLEFSHGWLRDIPDWIFAIPRLERLNFSQQQIADVSGEIGKAKRLRVFNISGNNVTFLPREIGLLKQLQALNVSHNPLLKLPTDIIYLTKLKQLDISNTMVKYLPINLAFLTDLTYLNIEDTQITKVDFLLQRRLEEDLRIDGKSRDIEVTTYEKREYENDRGLFPGTMMTATAMSLFAVGFGVKYLKNKKTKKGDFM